MKYEDIEWKLFELAEGELHGEELEFWENKIQTDPQIREMFLLFSQTYLTQESQKNNTKTIANHPLKSWGNMVYPDKESLKKNSIAHTVQNQPKTIRLFSFYNQYKRWTVAASLVMLGFILWFNRQNTIFRSPSNETMVAIPNQPAATPTELRKKQNKTEAQPGLKTSTRLEKYSATSSPVGINSMVEMESTPTKIHSEIHPLIAATENYLAKQSIDNSSNNKFNTVVEHADSKSISIAPIVEETIITVVQHRPQTNQEKRQLVAMKVKEMMRTAQLPNVKIQPSHLDRPGIIPSFHVQLHLDNTPVIQTSNR